MRQTSSGTAPVSLPVQWTPLFSSRLTRAPHASQCLTPLSSAPAACRRHRRVWLLRCSLCALGLCDRFVFCACWRVLCCLHCTTSRGRRTPLPALAPQCSPVCTCAVTCVHDTVCVCAITCMHDIVCVCVYVQLHACMTLCVCVCVYVLDLTPLRAMIDYLVSAQHLQGLQGLHRHSAAPTHNCTDN